MIQLLNPYILSKIIKNYIIDINRLWKFDEKQIKNYQDKAFRKIVKFAYNVELYHDKFKENGIHPNDIRGIIDIKKLPFTSKEDIKNYYPNGIIPKGKNPKSFFQISTSGSTGKPVFVYHDLYSAILMLILFLRQIKIFGANWRKTRFVQISDMQPGTIESMIFQQSAFPFINKIFSMKNIKYFHIGKNPEDLIKIINEFQPNIISSYPAMLRELAYLKNKGLGDNIYPDFIGSCGSILDYPTRKYVEKTFNTNIMDIYSCTELGPVAFQCLEKSKYHINNDFLFIEAIDDQDNLVDYKKKGSIVATRLYGYGTPIIRYKGLEDIIILDSGSCKCGINDLYIENVYGRLTDVIILPNGRIIPPLTITGIPGTVMDKCGVYSIKQFQIIQHDFNYIEILVIIDESRIKSDFTKDLLFKQLKNSFNEIVGNNVNIKIREVNEIQKEKAIETIKPVISKVKREDL